MTTLCGAPSPADLCPAREPAAAGARFPSADERPRTGRWLSADQVLGARNIRFLQVGGDTWNRCGTGWLNMDSAFDRGDGAVRPDEIFVDDTGRFNMKHIIGAHSRFPFADGSVQFVYSEHMIEHVLPSGGGVNFLREAWRVLAPGGLLRVVTPDLAKYACAFVDRGGSPGFLERHAARFAPMEALGKPPSRATIVNNIFRNYGHQWIYNLDELRLAARSAGIDPSLVCRSDRTGLGLPRWARLAMRRANAPRFENQTCWLDQEVREGESIYVNILKPMQRRA